MTIGRALFATLILTAAACASRINDSSEPPGSRSQAIEGSPCPDEWYTATPPNPSYPVLADILPIRYTNTDQITASFPATLAGLQSLLPDGLEPLEIAQGLGLFSVTFFDYREIVGLDPYREVALGVLVYDPFSFSAGLPFYIVNLIVTTQEAEWVGIEGWGYNKILGNSHCEEVRPKGIKCLVESGGTLVLKLEVNPNDPEMKPAPAGANNAVTLSIKDGYLVRAPVPSNLARSDATLISSSVAGNAILELGDNPIAETLKAVGIGTTSVSAAVGRHVGEELFGGLCSNL